MRKASLATVATHLRFSRRQKRCRGLSVERYPGIQDIGIGTHTENRPAMTFNYPLLDWLGGQYIHPMGGIVLRGILGTSQNQLSKSPPLLPSPDGKMRSVKGLSVDGPMLTVPKAAPCIRRSPVFLARLAVLFSTRRQRSRIGSAKVVAKS